MLSGFSPACFGRALPWSRSHALQARTPGLPCFKLLGGIRGRRFTGFVAA